jgi:hypothetical protein
MSDDPEAAEGLLSEPMLEKYSALMEALESVRGDVADCRKRLDAELPDGRLRKVDSSQPDCTLRKVDSGDGDGGDDGDARPYRTEESEAVPLAAGGGPGGRPDAASNTLATGEATNSLATGEATNNIDTGDGPGLEALKALASKQADELASLRRQAMRPIADSHHADRASIAKAQARADSVHIQLGSRAGRPLVAESPAAYRVRMAESLQATSKRWEGVKLGLLQDQAFAMAEEQIYADAIEQARRPSHIPGGGIREIRRQTPAGHMVSEFVGDAHFVEAFSPRSALRKIKSIRIES